MKRISELQEQAKRVCQEAEKEIQQIQESLNFFRLLDTDLAGWKQQLAGLTTPAAYKLVFYTDEDCSLLQYGRSTYKPSVDSKEPWSSKEWASGYRRSGAPAIIAYADDPKLLFPPREAAMRLGLFGFLYCICPSEVELPESKREDFRHLAIYCFGLYPLYNPEELSDSLKPFAGIEHPDLSDPKQLEIIFKARMKQLEGELGESYFQRLVEQRDALDKQIQQYRTAQEIQKFYIN